MLISFCILVVDVGCLFQWHGSGIGMELLIPFHGHCFVRVPIAERLNVPAHTNTNIVPAWHRTDLLSSEQRTLLLPGYIPVSLEWAEVCATVATNMYGRGAAGLEMCRMARLSSRGRFSSAFLECRGLRQNVTGTVDDGDRLLAVLEALEK